MTEPLYTNTRIRDLLDEIWLVDDRLLSPSLEPVRRAMVQMRDEYEANILELRVESNRRAILLACERQDLATAYGYLGMANNRITELEDRKALPLAE